MSMEKADYDTASIIEEWHCKDCGWPIIHVCCNGTFQDFKDAKKWDYWVYCSNKGCKNHEGQGVFQHFPKWIQKINLSYE
jgi:hypothetical protein